MQGTGNGGRRRERQKKRWKDNIREWTRFELRNTLRKAEDSEEWKAVVRRSSAPRQISNLRDSHDLKMPKRSENGFSPKSFLFGLKGTGRLVTGGTYRPISDRRYVQAVQCHAIHAGRLVTGGTYRPISNRRYVQAVQCHAIHAGRLVTGGRYRPISDMCDYRPIDDWRCAQADR
ncbi:hypothetical protein PoB_007374500 [Plakobranchus ocellatus]|uniref:Uncharacterized protein n=1 Tax=Plakobranchus ocellatus TaxID=259542 RepID=A0AAV4DTD0_9GAST|nr:hypothetical protein PoB_007374500 [Plakobranchus ocellatus]